MQKASQKDRFVDFVNDIFLRVSMYSNADFDLFISGIGQKLSLGGMFIVLFAADILLKKPIWCWKTDIEKRVTFFNYIYTFINKEKGYL